MPLPHVHITIIQPEGYVHSLGFLDQARFFRHQLRRLGAQVTMAKNRLREDAVNIVFGAHLGFATEALERHACVFVNLEQLGQGGARVSPQYLELLRSQSVIDYDVANIAAYGQDPAQVPVVSFAHAPYLPAPELPLEERPIDLLFFGSVNPRRQQFLARIEACGLSVASFDHPVYAEERDHYIQQAKAVVNCHFYETSRFEQARAFQCLSLGTPFISERAPQACPPPAFEPAVFWLEDDRLESFFRDHFGTPAFFEEARQRLAAFRQHDALGDYALLLETAARCMERHRLTRDRSLWQPTRLNLTDAEPFRLGWLNASTRAEDLADVYLELGQPGNWPLQCTTAHGAELDLQPQSLQQIHAGHVLVSTPDLGMWMNQALLLLQDGGELTMDIPVRHGPLAAVLPGRRRDLDETSWIVFTDEFWRSGWFSHRLELTGGQWLNLQRQAGSKADAAWLQMTLRKRATTARERTLARMHRADFGGIDEDLSTAHPSQAHASATAAPTAAVTVGPVAPSQRPSAPPHDAASASRPEPDPLEPVNPLHAHRTVVLH